MSTYRQYQEARDAAWRALLRIKDKTLPVDAEGLAQSVGVQVHPYPDRRETQRLWALAERVPGACVSLRFQGKWHMFVRESRLDESQRRFAVAHELGHLLLGHETVSLAPGVRRFRSPENDGDLLEEPKDPQDYAADIFAIRLLAPACLLHELHIDTAGGIARLCGLPPRACALRAERMELLNQRNAFYSNPLERQVRDAFRPYIAKAAAPPPTVPSDPAPPDRPPILLPLPERKEVAPPARSPGGKPKKRFSAPLWGKRALAGLGLAAALLALYWLGKDA